MPDIRTFLVSDATADMAPTDHTKGLETAASLFARVLNTETVCRVLGGAHINPSIRPRHMLESVMADDHELIADPGVVATWIKGWTLARETPLPVEDHGGFRVDVGWPQQRARYVFPRISPAMRELAATIAEPWVFCESLRVASGYARRAADQVGDTAAGFHDGVSGSYDRGSRPA